MKMKFYLIVLSLLAVCLWGTGDVRAQSASRSMTVTGKVVDQNGAAVTGASVVVVGTTKGTTTGILEIKCFLFVVTIILNSNFYRFKCSAICCRCHACLSFSNNRSCL